MLKVTNRQVIAIGITPRIDDVERDRIQELLDGTHPMSPSRKKYDTGTKRKTVLDQSPVGPEEIADEPDDRTSHDNVGSAYYENERPDDETGPGNTKNRDPDQVFTDHSNSELAFKNDFDTSSPLSPLNYESNNRDKNVTQHLRKLTRQPGVSAPKRKNVDELIRSRSAASNWNYLYTV